MDTHKLRIVVSNMKNANTRQELDRIRSTVLQNLSQLPAAPSVPFEKSAPPLATVRCRMRASKHVGFELDYTSHLPLTATFVMVGFLNSNTLGSKSSRMHVFAFPPIMS